MKNITFTDSKSRVWSYQIPFSIKCTVSGVEKTYTSEEYINGKIERFDGLENLRATYVCRDAKRANKPEKQPKVKKEKAVKTEEGVAVKIEEVEQPVSLQVKLEQPKPLTKAEAPKDTCHNPKWLLDGKACTSCAFSGICNYKDSPKGKLKKAKK